MFWGWDSKVPYYYWVMYTQMKAILPKYWTSLLESSPILPQKTGSHSKSCPPVTWSPFPVYKTICWSSFTQTFSCKSSVQGWQGLLLGDDDYYSTEHAHRHFHPLLSKQLCTLSVKSTARPACLLGGYRGQGWTQPSRTCFACAVPRTTGLQLIFKIHR